SRPLPRLPASQHPAAKTPVPDRAMQALPAAVPGGMGRGGGVKPEWFGPKIPKMYVARGTSWVAKYPRRTSKPYALGRNAPNIVPKTGTSWVEAPSARPLDRPFGNE